MRRLLGVAVLIALGCAEPTPVAEPSSPPPSPPEPDRVATPPPVEVTAPPAPAPEAPVVEAAVEDEAALGPEPDEENLGPPLDLALRSSERLGPSPWLDEDETAAAAGLIEPGDSDDETFLVEGTVEHQRRTYVLFRAPGGLPEYASLAATAPRVVRFALWLARLERRVDDDGVEQVRRVAAVRLHDLAIASSEVEYASCTVTSELRARDLDGDGEAELTVIAAAAAEPDDVEHCGAVAFLVGADDLNVQAAFTREHRVEHTGADGNRLLTDDTTWIVRDVNGDAHADLHVVERFTYRDDFEGDYVGGGETDPGWHQHASGRREVDCLYDAATDTWPCPPSGGVVVGGRVLGPPSALLAADVLRAFDGPPWTD